MAPFPRQSLMENEQTQESDLIHDIGLTFGKKSPPDVVAMVGVWHLLQHTLLVYRLLVSPWHVHAESNGQRIS